MKGEYISIETSKIMADIEKENKELHDRIDKAIKMLNELASLYDDNYTVSDKAKDIIIILDGGNNERNMENNRKIS